MIENPHEYNDDAYTEAINELQGNMPDIIDTCWKAGAAVDNLEDELTNAFNTTEGFAGRHVVVTITVT